MLLMEVARIKEHWGKIGSHWIEIVLYGLDNKRNGVPLMPGGTHLSF